MRYQTYSELKNTGIHWLPLQPEHWRIKRLRFVLTVNPVKSEVASLDEDIMVSFVPMEAVGENGGMEVNVIKPISDVYSGYTYFREGDTVVAKITPCFENGKGAISRELVNKIGFGTTEFHVLRASEELDKVFQFYLTLSHPFRKIGTSEMLGAGGQKRIPEDFIKDFRLGVPPFEEQQKIAAFLDYKTQQIDQLIAKKKALIEKLEEKRIAVITQAVTKGLDKNVTLKPSGVDWLGDVPEHWDVRKLKFVGDAVMGLIYEPKDIVNEGEGCLVLRASNIQNGNMVHNDDVFVTTSIPEKLIARSDDILICSRNGSRALIGKNALVGKEFEGCSFGAFTTVFRSDFNDFLYFVFNSNLFGYQAGKYLTSTINQLTIGVINSFEVPVPDEDERKRIVSYLREKLEKLNKSKAANLELINRLEEYRSALITSAVTGKIDVRNVKIPKETA